MKIGRESDEILGNSLIVINFCLLGWTLFTGRKTKRWRAKRLEALKRK